MSDLRDSLISEGLAEADVEDTYSIYFLSTEKANFFTQIKIYVEDTWMKAGDFSDQEYINDSDGIAAVNANVPDPYKTAILTVWGANKSDSEKTDSK